MTDDKKSVGEAEAKPTNGAGGPAETVSPESSADLPASGGEAERIAELEGEVKALKDQALRALAEAENTRRRAQREIEENNKYALANFAREVLPVADNLRRALDAIPADARAADKALDSFAQGVELTERELLAVLERFGVKRVEPSGQPFDHNLHQAVMQMESADQPAGTVVQVLQSGYTLHGRLLRPAMVAVAKTPAEAARSSLPEEAKPSG
ncbi:MAG TPA: nucleotide exchange factor GrpE [Alphaproteobacteria bacterium]|nr:nucleotide exchange factor GrpE [Alphaproteobacteria bacterium]